MRLGSLFKVCLVLNSPHIPMLHCTSIDRQVRWWSYLQIFPVHYIPPSPDINLDKLVDHVHLNEEGYALFAKSLLEKMDELRLEL
jgi:lysophospholipase L1-like esterase